MPYSGKELIKLLESYGFVFVRQKGSHVILQRIVDTSKTTIVVPDHKEIRTGTLNSIIRKSKLDKDIFTKR